MLDHKTLHSISLAKLYDDNHPRGVVNIYLSSVWSPVLGTVFGTTFGTHLVSWLEKRMVNLIVYLKLNIHFQMFVSTQWPQDMVTYMWRTVKPYKLPRHSHSLGIHCSRAHWSRQSDELFYYLPVPFFSSLKMSIWNAETIKVSLLKALESWNIHFRRLPWLESKFTFGGKSISFIVF